jgi:hypothetical protein
VEPTDEYSTCGYYDGLGGGYGKAAES